MTTSRPEHKNFKFQPLQDRILVKRTESEGHLKSGLVLPDSAKKKQETAIVVAVGPGKPDQNGQLTPPPVKIGETVLMDKYSGQDLSLQDEDFVVVRSSDIIATVEL